MITVIFYNMMQWNLIINLIRHFEYQAHGVNAGQVVVLQMILKSMPLGAALAHMSTVMVSDQGG